MKKYSQIQKIISILMSFILMTELTGCYSTKTISTSEMSVSDKYLIHGKNSTYSLDNVVISDGILSGKLNFSQKNYSNATRNYIYLSSDSLLRITNDLLTVPVSSIAKIEQKVPDPGKTSILTFILIVAGIGIGVAGIIGIIALVKSAKTVAGSSGDLYKAGCTNY